jgi:FADH2 O2-dependent halogenase
MREMRMKHDFDIAVIGSGFGGSLMGMIAKRLGRSVVLLERGRHPRFAIGESSTPLANLLLEELARRYDLPQIAPLSKWGTWQKTHPQIGCGLKRGFTFYHHRFGQRWRDEPSRSNQLLVAASPHDGVADTHWYRPDFDHFFVGEAQALGVEFLDQTSLQRVELSTSGVELSGEREGRSLKLRARFAIDASGPRGFLHHSLALDEVAFETMPATQALYTHFDGVRRWDELHPSTALPPYPVDDAAMHHVFDGGWIWVLRFNNLITSAGVAATRTLANDLRLADGARAWERLLERLPSVREQFVTATARLPFVHAPALSFRSSAAAGTRWALLPSAAGFVDPLLSTGFPLTLLGIERLAKALEQEWNSSLLAERLRDYDNQTLGELDITASLVSALYANLSDFEVFTALALLYFAAAMYAETMRRLQRPEAGLSFLLQDHSQFGPACRQCLKWARVPLSGVDRRSLLKAIAKTIEPIDLAGLGNAARRNWYPCQAKDLLAAAPKLGAGRAAIEQLLARCGFTAA